MATGQGTNQGKTAFVEAFLPENRDADHLMVSEAWKAAGNQGTVSESLVSKARSRLKLSKARGTKGGKKRAASGPGAKGKARPPEGETAQASPSSAEPVPAQAKGPNKTAFIRELLALNSTL